MSAHSPSLFSFAINSALSYRNEPLQPFGYKTAQQLVSEGRTDDLLRYIVSLETGVAG